LHLAELDAAGEAVDQGHAEQEERGGVRAEQEVLESRLLAEQPPTAGQRAQQVEREGEDLERDEHGQQVVRGDEQEHAAEGEDGQRVDLGGAGSRAARLPHVLLPSRPRSPPAKRTRRRPRTVLSADQQHRHDAEQQDAAPQETASGQIDGRPRRRS
jgi:hypothetical protein